MTTRRFSIRHLLTALAIVGMLLQHAAASATVVGDGTAESCSQSAMMAAVNAGGRVTFNCGSSPLTIPAVASIDVRRHTMIDGGGLITIQPLGTGPTPVLFNPVRGALLVLKNLSISDGNRWIVNLAYGAHVTMRNCTIEANGGGPALFNWYGRLDIQNSRFIDNVGGITDKGGVISNFGRLRITDSIFTNNSNARIAIGGAIFNYGAAVIRRSTFEGNIIDTPVVPATNANGGAINNQGVMRIYDSEFTSNHTVWDGGAIANGGKLKIVRSVFTGNTADHGGDTIANLGSGGGQLVTNDYYCPQVHEFCPLQIIDSPTATVN